MDRLLEGAKKGRYGIRDYALTPVRIMQDYLGHRSWRHTHHYTRVPGQKFESLWK